MKKRTLLFMLGLFFLSLPAEALEIREGQELSLEECLDIVLEKHPDLKSAGASVEVSRSGVDQAEAPGKPGVDLSSSYRRQDAGSSGYDSYSSGVTVSQLISDWGKTKSQVLMAEMNVEASRYDYDDVLQTLFFDVKQAYFDLLRARKEEEVAREAVRTYEHHLEQARGFFEVGRVSKIDVTTAEVDLSKARLELIKKKTAVETAKASLSNALGYPEAPSYRIRDMLSWEKVDITRQEALQSAFMTRPDLRALELRRNRAEESVNLARKNDAPSLSAKAGYTWGDRDFTGNGETYVGLSLTVPLYDGGLTRGKVRQARGELEKSEANLESLRQDVVLEVEKAFSELRNSEEAIGTAQKTVEHAKENLELANGRYEVGVGSPVEVTDATENYTNAQNDYYGSLYDYRLALGALEKAIGGALK
ncbi:MAG TPA: TolC family protein [Synergistaceae bacterium]|nr:TolC family protein [Synergistaceae bacterium]HPJ26034.1 TolC family protein [Synergistaceae bacterium]HPQ38016.1 TolC family protein [Synergistaceae bacterium]